jgi:hypothetical protein
MKLPGRVFNSLTTPINHQGESKMQRITTLLILTFALAACGGSDDDAGDAGNGNGATAAASRVATGMRAPDVTLVDLDPCELFTADESGSYLDGYRESEQAIRGGMKECQHKGGSFTSVRVQVGGMSLEDFETRLAVNHNLMGDVELQSVTGVGDKAYFLRSLWVHSGDYILHVDVNSLLAKRDSSGATKRDQGVEIARQIVARL